MSTAVTITESRTAAPRIPPELAGFCVAASNLEQGMKVCEFISKTTLIPKAYQNNPAAIWVAGAMGVRLGIDLFTAMGGIASINGRPAVWGDLLRGLILSSPLLEDLVESMEGAGDALTAVCTIKRKGMSPYTARFGIADAKAAGLLGRETWRGYGPDMLINRAFGRAARRRFADLLSGLAVAEEAQDAEVVEVRNETPALTHAPSNDGVGAARKPATAVAKTEKTTPAETPAATQADGGNSVHRAENIGSTSGEGSTPSAAQAEAVTATRSEPSTTANLPTWQDLKTAYDAAHKVDPAGTTETCKMHMDPGMRWSDVPEAVRAELIRKLEVIAGA